MRIHANVALDHLTATISVSTGRPVGVEKGLGGGACLRGRQPALAHSQFDVSDEADRRGRAVEQRRHSAGRIDARQDAEGRRMCQPELRQRRLSATMEAGRSSGR